MGSSLILGIALAVTGCAVRPPEIDALWEYSDPAASEARFRASLEQADGDARLEILTQIARTYSLRERFAEANAVLDEVEPRLASSGPRPRVRYLLERGRTLNSAGEPEKARALFVEAWERAGEAREEGLAVDAAHMVAITYAGTMQGVEWNRRGLALARASSDEKARSLIPALLNNCAWDLHGMGRYEEALAVFEEAQREWTALGKPRQIEVAKWSVARCLRSLGRWRDALAILRALEAEQTARGAIDRDVALEIAADLEALGEGEEARRYRELARSER